MLVLKKSLAIINKIATVLKKGGVVICPTDTVYGFLADASNKKAVEKIYEIKKRPRSKSLPVFVVSIKMAREIAVVDERTANFLKKNWPGKVTTILKRKVNSLTKPTAVSFVRLYGVDKKTIALRIPKYSFLNKLLKKMNRPLVQTSVNISTKPPLANIEDIKAEFGKNKLVDFIVDAGNLKHGKPSKIVDLAMGSSTILRR